MNAPHVVRDFSDVGYDEALRRARDLIPFLREHAAAAEKATRLTPEILDALHRTGLVRFLQPKKWGGMELDFVAYFDIPEMLGRGDASTAWTVANLAAHHRALALWSPRAQEEIWGENSDALIASGIAYIQGRARKAPGGLELSGEWGYSSGVDASGWCMLACVVNEGDKPVDWSMCMVPCADYEIVDDWQTLGMRATGSRTVRCKDVFVPEHRVISMHVALPGHEFPGVKVNANPMFRIPAPAVGGYCIAGALIGNAQAALEATIESVKARSTSYTAAKMRDLQTVQLRIGMAGARIDAARTWLRHNCLEVDAVYRAGGVIDVETKLRYKRDCALGMKLANEAVDSLYEMAGAQAIYDNSPMQRIFRDAHAAAGHFNFSTDAQLAPWGLVALGGEVKSPTL
jgi:3-hydroxy-9,10-secoandrosta-1,3,5(10)-triene-9,17-dione monooxygenase